MTAAAPPDTAPAHPPRPRASHFLLLLTFGLSGAAALIYQVCWQRILFTSFGVDIESTTIIVSTFMLGLGCGALIGGALADRFQAQRVRLFALAELGIGLFGLASPVLLRAVADHTFDLSVAAIAAVNFALILVPTVLMGGTLPVLVAELVARAHNVGVSIGALYSSNTLGACLGALAAGVVLLNFLTLDQSIYLAAAFNFVVAVTVYLNLGRARA